MNSETRNCEQWKTQLDVYIDGELSAADMRACDAHLRGCPSCAADTLARVHMKREVQAAGKRFAPSAAFRQKIQRTTAAQLTPRSSLWQWSAGMALAGLLLGVALSLNYFGTSPGQPARAEAAMLSEVVDLHVAALASATPVDVISSDRHTVKPWFEGKLPFTFYLPELQDSNFSLVGGRVTYLEQAPGAHLIYQIGKHRISVLVFQEKLSSTQVSPATPATPARTYTFSTETWGHDGLRYYVIGDAEPGYIHKLAALLKAAAQP